MKSTRKADLPLLKRLESEAHVWFSTPEAVTDPGKLADYMSILSPQEQERHQRFHFEKDRHSFLISHALVRKVLSTYVDAGPADWQFSAGRHGRPEIAGPAGVPALRFNLTHTAGLTGCLVTLDADCGIDAELLTRRGKLQAIAEKMFADAELVTLNKLDGHAFLEQFFIFWTLREAYCKALGVGLGFSKKDYAFEAGSDDGVKIRFDAPAGNSGKHWQFTILRPGADYVAAVAIRSEGRPGKEIVHRFIVP
ncbi:MAG TPA: 4-phosphopantetheinyl transferase [Gammaproteobacteria bacterium]|nr:4-phosphopantetheinyl transferase [Gammaproteobacteria bacterium]